MGNHLKNESLSSRNGKYNHKSGWLTGMFHMLDFHRWRTKNRPICWKTPRTHSLVHEIDENEPFLEDSKMLSVGINDKPTKTTKIVTTNHVKEYVDFLEILRKEEVVVKILKDPNSEFGKQVHIKSNPRFLPKSGSFPLRGSLRPARIEDKQKENWYAPKKNSAILTLNVPRDTSQEHKPISPSDDHGFNHAVIQGFREIKKLLKNTLRNRKHTKKKSIVVSKDDHMGKYSQLLEKSFERKGGQLRSNSLKLSYEDKKSDSRDIRPQFFRRISSLSSLEVLGSFLTDLPRDSFTRKHIDQETNFGSKKSLVVSESTVRIEKGEDKDEEHEERSQENNKIIQKDQDSVPITEYSDTPTQDTETSLSQGLISLEIYNHEEKEEEKDVHFCYVKKVLEVSGFLEDNREKWYSDGQPMNPSLLYELKIQEEEELLNKELLFDLVNEAITETRNQSQIYFPKTISFVYPNEKRFIDEVWKRVECTLYGLGDENKDRSLDDIVEKDLSRCDGWMSLRGEHEWLTLELEDLIFDEVLDELLCV